MLAEWESTTDRLGHQGELSLSSGSEDDEKSLYLKPNSVRRVPLFSVDILDSSCGRGHGDITSRACQNHASVAGTTQGWLVKHAGLYGEDCEIDLKIPGWGEQFVHNVFLDPLGNHALACVRSSLGGGETFYLHMKWKKARLLNKLKGAIVSCVAWNEQKSTEGSAKEVLIGTSGGQLFEIQLDERDKQEKQITLLYDLQENKEPISGIQMKMIRTESGDHYAAMAVTPTKLFYFAGTGDLKEVFAGYQTKMPKITEFPGKFRNSHICFRSDEEKQEISFAWLASPGLYYGQLKLANDERTETTDGADEFRVHRKGLLEYSKLGPEGKEPVSMVLSKFHFLLLYSDRIKVVNCVNLAIVEQLLFVGPFWPLGPKGLLGLRIDESTSSIYAFAEQSYYEIYSSNEGRDMLQIFLDRKMFPEALSMAVDEPQRDLVFSAQADEAYSHGRFEEAAVNYGKIAFMASFEEVALKFVVSGQQAALRIFLECRLEKLERQDVSQMTLIATWLTELHLNRINSLLLKSSCPGKAAAKPDSNGEIKQAIDEFRSFLSEKKDVLDETMTVKLLGSYGRESELLHFATIVGKHEMVVQHHIRKGNASGALSILLLPNVPSELQYKYGPALVQLAPTETVDAWIACGNRLTPRRLIPSILSFVESNESNLDGLNEATRYLQFCVRRLHSDDSAIHNLLVSLYAKQDDESALLRFLSTRTASDTSALLGHPIGHYDPKFALRVCLENRRLRSCIFIYGMMGMHEEAVALALQVDLELAKMEAKKVEDDRELQKKLWLMIVRHVVQKIHSPGEQDKEYIKEALSFLKEADGLLKIEDILPYFPDFAIIDDFKDAICSSLEEYNREIEDLKTEMKETMDGADTIRQDMAALANRCIIVDKEESCSHCGKRLMVARNTKAITGEGALETSSSAIPPFYVFPCEHSFHSHCLLALVMEYLQPEQREVCNELRRRLGKLSLEPSQRSSHKREDNEDMSAQMNEFQKVRSQLDDVIAGECPFCGDFMINEITKPFVKLDESELSSWQIDGG